MSVLFRNFTLHTDINITYNMGRKSVIRERKQITPKVKLWLSDLLMALQFENLELLTIDDIANLAGKSKSTIYEYFKSKEDILLAICQERINKLSVELVELINLELDIVPLYEKLIELFSEGTAGISITFLRGIREHYPDSWLIIDNFTDIYVDVLKAHYQQGIESNIYNASSIDLMGHIDKLFIVQVITNPDIFSDEKHTIGDLARDYLNLRLNGLLKR